jgi:hypothetical protein
MTSNLVRARGGLIATTLMALGSLTACLEEVPSDTTNNSPSCTVNCGSSLGGSGGNASGGTTSGAGAVTAGGMSGASPGGAATGGASAGGASTGGVSAGGTTAGASAGGTTAGGTAGGSGAGDLPCDVKKIVQERCGSCHGQTPSAGAYMALVTPAHWHAQGTTDKTKQYYQLAKARINSTTSAMPPPSIGELTAAEKQTLNAWLDQNAPAGNTACMVAPVKDPNDIDVSGLECYKLLAHAPGSKSAKYKVGAAVDRYTNFGFQAPWQGMLYGLVTKPVIDNSRALHHWLLYREPVQDGSIQETIGQHAGGEMINGWAPGGETFDFRKHGDVSFELPSTTYSIEIHYNSSDPNAEDASGVEICGTRTPTKNVASLTWLGYDQGGTLSYASGICLNPATTWTGTCSPAAQEPIHMLFMTPHLHQAGRHLKSVINGPNGSRVLHDKPFSFDYQITYPTTEVLMPGESITTTCTFSEPKCAGQSTTQEMCYLYVYAWPKKTLVDYGIEGTFMHGEGVCLGQ